MSEETQTTVEEIVELSEDRKSWLVFSSGVDHAHMLANVAGNLKHPPR